MRKLTEQRLRRLVREEIQKLNEVDVVNKDKLRPYESRIKKYFKRNPDVERLINGFVNKNKELWTGWTLFRNFAKKAERENRSWWNEDPAKTIFNRLQSGDSVVWPYMYQYLWNKKYD